MTTLGFILRLAGAAVAVVYLLNPTAGVFELLPDTLPIVGNLDEAAAVGLLIACVRGIRRARSSKAPQDTKPLPSQEDTRVPPTTTGT